jgi:hypothetical protein
MKNVFFKPYIGKNYFEKGYSGKKLMILGESHYCSDLQDKDCQCGQAEKCLQLSKCEVFTTDALNRFFDYKKGIAESEPWMTTFTRFTDVFLGKKVSNEKLLAFWDDVMFYNYVQKAIGGSRTSPAEQNFEDSEKAFFEVLDTYQPDLIIVWGARLEGRLPKKNKTVSDFEILNKAGHKFHYYEVSGKKIPAYAIYHPSYSSFSYDFHESLKEAVRLSETSIGDSDLF